MSKIQWEYDLVEKPFCEQLQAMGWEWIEGDPDLPESTERASSREVLLLLGCALRRSEVAALTMGQSKRKPKRRPSNGASRTAAQLDKPARQLLDTLLQSTLSCVEIQ